MNRFVRQLKPAAQRFMFGPGQPLVRAANRAIDRWQNFALVRDNDPRSNGELWLVDSCDPDGVYVDVGYNAGDWSRYVLERHPAARVAAFDPDPGAARAAADVTDPRLRFERLALGAAPGRLAFHSLGPCNPANSLSRPRYQNAPDTMTVSEVDVVRLDDWADTNGIDRIALLKIDAEGYDLQVAQGADRLLAAGRVDVCVLEYSFAWLETRVLLADAARFFAGHNYEMYRLYPSFLAPYTWRWSDENVFVGQFVAVKRGKESRFAIRQVG